MNAASNRNAGTADDLIRRFHGLKSKPGGGWMARCPAHDDTTASLSIDIRGGKMLVKCFANCTAEAIADAAGLGLADLFLEDSRPAIAAPVVPTVDTLAAAKGLPVATLRRFGVRNVTDLSSVERLQHGIKATEGVWIPYFNQDGSIASRTRLRKAHVAKEGSSWCGSFGAPLPYGLHDLAEAREQGILVICEGESDYWSLREMGAPALGIPGASMASSIKREYLPAGVHTVYIAQDADAAGAGFAATLRELCAGWGLQAVPVRFGDGCKDANDFYRKDSATAAERLIALLAAAAASSVPAAREFTTAGEIYRYTLPEWEIALEVDQIQRKWGDLVGELAVLRDGGADIFRGNLNLSNVERRQGVALQVAKRAKLKEIDWPALMEEFAVLCLKAERQGRPGVWLDEVEPRAADRCLTVCGFELPLDLPACLFGDGDTGKSYLSLYLLGHLARAGIACGIVDAEMEGAIHAERLAALFGDKKPRIAHIRLDRPLALSVDHVRRFVRDMELRYLLYDSVGFLTPEPEKSESALSYMRAVRQVGCGSLSVAHVTKQQDVRPEQQKPFGSNFYFQSFRRIWYAQAESEPDADGRKVIGIWDRKANTARKRPPFGLALTVRDGFASVEPAELSQSDELGSKLPTRKRIEILLQRGAMTPDAIADTLEITVNASRVALTKGKKAGLFVQIPGGSGLWGLAAKE